VGGYGKGYLTIARVFSQGMPDVGDESFARRIVGLRYVQSQHIAEKLEVLQAWEKVLQDIVAGKVTECRLRLVA